MPKESTTHQSPTFFNPEKLEFPIYPEEGMEFLIEKLGSRIQVNPVNKFTFITPVDPSITVQVTREGSFQFNHLFLNGKKIATTGAGKTTIDLGEMIKQLDIVDDLDLDFSTPPSLSGVD